MARVQVGNGFFLDMTNLNIGGLASGTTTFRSATRMTLVHSDTVRDEFYGSFSYAQNGALTGGTLYGIQEVINGYAAFEITGFSVPVATFSSWIASGNTYQALAGMLAGNDTVLGNGFSDALMGFGGNDSMDGGGAFDLMDGGTGNDTLYGGAGNDFIVGMEDNDFVFGGDGDDDINGNMGDDTVRGGEGYDFVRGGKGADYVLGDAGDDPHVNGNLGDDQVYGGEGADNCFGGQGNDFVDGQGGDDFLSGDLGNDTLQGGAGRDGFLISPGGGNDVVLDFKSAEGDRVLLWTGTQYSIHASGGNMVVELAAGGSLTLIGVTQAALGDWLQFI